MFCDFTSACPRPVLYAHICSCTCSAKMRSRSMRASKVDGCACTMRIFDQCDRPSVSACTGRLHWQAAATPGQMMTMCHPETPMRSMRCHSFPASDHGAPAVVQYTEILLLLLIYAAASFLNRSSLESTSLLRPAVSLTD